MADHEAISSEVGMTSCFALFQARSSSSSSFVDIFLPSHITGHVVLVMEERDFVTHPQRPPRRVPVVIRGTCDRLIQLLVPELLDQQPQQDPTFAEDFLTTFPLFLDTVQPICTYLSECLKQDSIPVQKKAANVITHWVSADFGLFERLNELGDFLEEVEGILEQNGLVPQLKLLLLASHSRSRSRHLVIPLPPPSTGTSSLETAGFQITGGLEQRAGIFVSQVDHTGKAWKAGLRRGDQVSVTLLSTIDITERLAQPLHVGVNFHVVPILDSTSQQPRFHFHYLQSCS